MSINFSVFISHHHSDETLAGLLKDFLESIFLNCNVFVSGKDIAGGELWCKEIKEKLFQSKAIISLITKYSINSSWVIFETGAGFTNSKSIPLCADTIKIKDLIPPLSLLNARRFTSDGIKSLVKDIARMADIRSPANFPGLDEMMKAASNFLSMRSKSESIEQIGQKLDSFGKKKEYLYSESIKQKIEKMEERIIKALILNIQKLKGKQEIPSPDEIKNMKMKELLDIARYYNVPAPYEAIMTFILSKRFDNSFASKWELMNAEKNIEMIDKEIDKYVFRTKIGI